MSQSPDTIVRSPSSREVVITALIDTLFPRCTNYTTQNDSEIISKFYSYKGSDFQGVALKVLEAIEKNVPTDAKKELHMLLWLLGTRFGTLILAGRSSFTSLIPTAFSNLPLASREQVLLQWATSSNAKFRKAFVALKGLILPPLFTWLSPQGTSPLLEALKYNITDPLRPLRPLPQALEAESSILAALVDLSNNCDGSQAGIAHAAASLTSKGLSVHWPGHTYGLSSALWRQKPAFVVEIDAVVVGSGAGGGVTAARLAAAGLRVLVLEKSTFIPAEHLSQKEGESFENMYECAGLMSTESGGTAVLAGSTLGGGTRINWNASFKTPDHVRREWAEKYGLESFTSPEYEAAMEAVCGRIGVRHGFQHGGACSALAAGLEAAGMHCGEVPRNCVDLQCSGHCCLGCARGAKQDTVNTFLDDACTMGTRIVTGAYVEKIITQKSKKDSQARASGRSKEAIGVLVHIGPQTCPLKIAFAAPIVVSCAGSIHTPAFLLRSGITGNGTVGANLRLHPCTCVVGMFTESSPPIVPYLGETGGNAPGFSGGSAEKGFIRCSDGPIMSVFSRQGAEWEGSGYGCVLYTPATHPGLFAFACPWYGGQSFKDLVLQYPNAVPVLVLVRDQMSGRVVIDKEGRPRLHYVVSEEDKVSMMKGMQMGLQALVAGGANGVMTLLNSQNGKFEFSAEDSASLGGREALENVEFQRYLKRVQAVGIPDLKLATFSAHQMGTCCLGTNPETSALDPRGESWDVNGLYCCDGSTFPTSLGVNPMVTIESIAYFLAGEIGEKWRQQRETAEQGMQQSLKKGRKPVLVEYENNATAKL